MKNVIIGLVLGFGLVGCGNNDGLKDHLPKENPNPKDNNIKNNQQTYSTSDQEMYISVCSNEAIKIFGSNQYAFANMYCLCTFQYISNKWAQDDFNRNSYTYIKQMEKESVYQKCFDENVQYIK